MGREETGMGKAEGVEGRRRRIWIGIAHPLFSA